MVDQAVLERLLVQLEEYLRDLDEIKLKYRLSDYTGKMVPSLLTL